jgi:hypothetical protein
MDKPIRTKKALLARIGRGPTAVQLIANTSLFRVSVPEDSDPNGGVWIALVPALHYMIDDYMKVYVRVAGRELRLTRTEADAVALYVRRIMQSRARSRRARRSVAISQAG